MSTSAVHIAVDRIVPVYLGRDMEFILARIAPPTPRTLLIVDEDDPEYGKDSGEQAASGEMLEVGRVRLAPSTASGLAISIIQLVAAAGNLDFEALDGFIRALRDEHGIEESKH